MTAAATTTAPAKPRRPLTQRLGFDRFSALYLWAAFMIFFGVTQDNFLTHTSINLVLTGKVVVAVLGLAFLVPLAGATFDLSIGALMGFSVAVTMALARNTSIPQGLCALIAIALCALVGFISGFIVVKLNVNSFIATLGMSQVLAALCILVSGNRTLNNNETTGKPILSASYRDFGRRQLLFDLPVYFYLMLLLAVVVWFVLEHTPFGRYMFATGGNREAARLSGVKTNRLTWSSLVISATIAGFAGTIHTWKVGVYNSSTGPGYLFPAIAAVFFGASQLRGRPNVWGTLIAVFALAFGVKGLQLTFTSGTEWIEPLFEGASLLIAVAFASRQGIVKIPKRKPKTDATPPPATAAPAA
jgi:ribose transport system permease protein